MARRWDKLKSRLIYFTPHCINLVGQSSGLPGQMAHRRPWPERALEKRRPGKIESLLAGSSNAGRAAAAKPANTGGRRIETAYRSGASEIGERHSCGEDVQTGTSVTRAPLGKMMRIHGPLSRLHSRNRSGRPLLRAMRGAAARFIRDRNGGDGGAGRRAGAPFASAEFASALDASSHVFHHR